MHSTYGLLNLTELLEFLAECRIVGVPCKASASPVSAEPVEVGHTNLPNEQLRHGAARS